MPQTLPYKSRNAPRWLIVVIDLTLTVFAIFSALHLRFEFNVPPNELDILLASFPLYLSVRLISFIWGKTYAGIIRYTGFEDFIRIFKTLAIGSAVLTFSNFARYYFFDGNYFFPLSVLVIDFLLCCLGLLTYRLVARTFYQEAKNPTKFKSKVIVYGAGEAGVITKRTLDQDAETKLKVVAFVDDDEKKARKTLEGVPIYHTRKLVKLIEDQEIDQIILAIQKPKPDNKQRIIDVSLDAGIEILNVPPVNNWINGQLSFKQLKPIKAGDLLPRKEILLDKASIRSTVSDKTILVTGAAGSIGSEIVRQLTLFNPKKIILLDQAETPLYELELELEEYTAHEKIESVLGDVRNEDRMRRLFQAFEPQVIYHAAAYKHVPMIERNPSEALLTNILGTKIMADLANDFSIETFVLISTDKAVNPTNVMGASKRVAEIYCQALDEVSKTNYITTRFGNVLGSSGSVIPVFQNQIEKGGPVTVTHEEVNRFFMTISEACQLVLEASAMGKGGEIFIFDMGESVKIMDLAKRMIQLSGLEPDKDIKIEVTGLRPGEKLHEEVLADEENTLPTHHKKILIAKVRSNAYEFIHKEIEVLIQMFEGQDNQKIVSKIKHLVPEYVSENSIFEELDN